MSATLSAVPDLPPARLPDTEWQRLDNEVRGIVSDEIAHAADSDRRGMLLAADLTALFRDGRWADETGDDPTAVGKFGVWASERYGNSPSTVVNYLGHYRRSEAFPPSVSPAGSEAVKAVIRATGYQQPLDAVKDTPALVTKAAALAAEETGDPRAPFTANHVKLAAQEMREAIAPKTRAERARTAWADQQYGLAMAIIRKLCEKKKFATVARILKDGTKLARSMGAGT